ncbi:MAG: hypothetical protein EOP45_14345 [Sphingobacteriaceae bacterium]|nr:MAG: hypothetical protein EOP45_14345 [Sphingobacteriaceae bacterium]
MNHANALPYYPRFVFNCSNGECLSTGDLEFFESIKDLNSSYDITSFVPGEKINIYWPIENSEPEIKTYLINRIEIHQIKYDLDKAVKGENSNDCKLIYGREKKWLMDVYIFLDILDE